jgi:F-type H+-transporting ATPase subunit gamma
MTQLAEIEAHIGNMAELRDIVGAMRSLAGMRMQEAQRVLPAIRRYAETVSEAIGDALHLLPASMPGPRTAPGSRGLVLCSAEHGFVGGFNERIFDAAEALAGPDDPVFILGSRGAVLAQERGRTIAWTHAMATRPEGVPDTVRRLTTELDDWIARRGLTRIEVVFARHSIGSAGGGAGPIERRLLVPLDPVAIMPGAIMPGKRLLPPLHNLPADILLERLTADYVFALLTEAAVESLASENAARFAAMEAAHDNVSKKLNELRDEGRRARQDEITTELLDLVTGAAVQSGGKKANGSNIPLSG